MRFGLTTIVTTLAVLVADVTAAPSAELETRALTADQTGGLTMQNNGRATGKIRALAWDATLASQATAYAQQLGSLQRLQHSGVGGENLFYESAGTKPYTDAAVAWMKEAPYYHHEAIPQGAFSSYGHYTQCMWNTTTKVGMGAYKDSNGAWWVVARYSPPGNYVGKKPF
ncbi:putative scp-like extracellular protein [Phaeoacremonium minimum UCRPA7]|uniref:Putative scp-like extracellular protein n=1 Tax=Phaeoacremonium minimum (strain UCR-PA7) TaxID=1286976 RepID=R8BP55_PHAM7|nr:putative scp-like extracellular protein [Phaeoacremonium minimum UCRPA7]EOO01114.1 putative scp-like extracellular protein [Phaeoacremonium minimum UCRPA7]